MRASIACLENVVSSAERRGILTGEKRVLARAGDLAHLVAACRGKIELLLAEDGTGSEDKLVAALVGEALKHEFAAVADVDDYDALIEQFHDGLTLTLADDMAAADLVETLKQVKGLCPAAVDLARKLKLDAKDEQAVASAGEFLLEALYVGNRLSKSLSAAGAGYGR